MLEADILLLFKALADGKRIKVAAAIMDRPASVEEIAAQVDLPAPLVSRHLARLEEAGLAQSERRGRATFYRFHQQPLLDALRSIADQPEPQVFGDVAAEDQKVLSTFIENDRLKSIPAQQKKRDVILRYLVERFEVDRMYGEKEVNAILKQYHDDVASLRRYLVDGGFLRRQVVRVVPVDALMEGQPSVDLQITYWRPSGAEPGSAAE